MIMKAGDNGMNQVLVNRPCLEDYIRKEYPRYKLISSTTKRILNTDDILRELDKGYFLVVLDYDLNHNERRSRYWSTKHVCPAVLSVPSTMWR